MGIIYPQAVKIHPNVNNFKYFKNLGYHIPMKPPTINNRSKGPVMDRNATFDVLIDDLSRYSDVILWYYCDCCGELNYMRNDVFKIHHSSFNEPIYCNKCLRSRILVGELHPHWKKEKTDEERQIERNYPEYDEFVKRVLARDNYTCQCCGEKKCKLEVHHLNGYNWDKEHRTDDTNGITLCENCHENFHCLYGNGNNTKEQFEEWIGRRIELTHYFGEIYKMPKVYCIEDNNIYENRFEAAKILNTNPRNIYYVCSGKCYTFKGKHYVYYENYLKMSEEDVFLLLSKGMKSPALCITTGKLFNTTKEASNYYNISDCTIFNAYSGKIKSAGVFQGIGLFWKKYLDFLNLPLQEQLQIAINNQETLEKESFLYKFLEEHTQ